jgi:hypothetical protein
MTFSAGGGLELGIAHRTFQNERKFYFFLGTLEQLVGHFKKKFGGADFRLHVCGVPVRYHPNIVENDLTISNPNMQGHIIWKKLLAESTVDSRLSILLREKPQAQLFVSEHYFPLLGIMTDFASKALREKGLKGLGSFFDGAAAVLMKALYGATHLATFSPSDSRIAQLETRGLDRSEPNGIDSYIRQMLKTDAEGLVLREIIFDAGGNARKGDLIAVGRHLAAVTHR